MENPRVRLNAGEYCLLDVGLWDLINMHIVTGKLFFGNLDNVDLYLNNEKVEKPIFEEGCG